MSIRDYENSNLPLERRLPSLARRFASLKKAIGLDPWSPENCICGLRLRVKTLLPGMRVI